jgi:hypothetical protein
MNNLSERLEVFQSCLIALATNGSATAEEYQEGREEVVNHALLKDIAPRFLRTCRTSGEFWQFIKYKHSTYADRRQYLWDEFRPMFERIDGSKATPADHGVSQMLEQFDTASVHQLWLKALERRETEPEGAITWPVHSWNPSANTFSMNMSRPINRIATCPACTRWRQRR